MAELKPAVRTILDRCLAVRTGEEVVVIADPATQTIGEAIADGAKTLGTESVLLVMTERREHGNEPPRTVAAALEAADVFIAPTTKSLSHTRARKAATEAGARGATMPGVTEDMLARVMAVDFDRMARRSRAVAALLSEASEAHVTCPRGSDLRLDLTGREGTADDGGLTFPGAFGNLPCGEGFVSPLDGEGTVVVSSRAGLGISDEPATLEIAAGVIRNAHGGLGPTFLERLAAHGDAGRNLAELGVGTNDRATLTGSMLEDEKMLGTVHVAFGASAGIGGTVSVPIHLDAVVLDASLEIGGRRVLDAGVYVLDDS
jgi:leucyl aminopeptidase (aminopeptidase T)